MESSTLARNHRANVETGIGMRSPRRGTFSYRAVVPLVTLLCLAVRASPVRAQRAQIVVVAGADSGDPRFASLERGLTLGIDEATRTARLFGVALRVLPADGLAADSVGIARMAAWILAGDARRCDAVRARLRGAAVAIVDAGCRVTDEPLAAEVRIHPSPTDSAAAVQEGRDSTARVLLWHASLARFGADQLNDRFRRRFGVDMDSDAWAAWAAVKIATEACLRARQRGVATAAVLLDPGEAFDAHKGAPLRFDPATRRLVQPLYALTTAGASSVIREIAPPLREQ